MKNQTIIIAAISLFVGLGGGFIIGRMYTLSTHSHNTTDTHTDNHSPTTSMGDHESIDVTGDTAPTVLIKVTKDAKSGWNVHVDTTNFRFAPEHAGQENIAGEGHAHLYVDGQKVSRLYGPDYHYDEKLTGEHTFRVALNGNNHAEYRADGKPVVAEVTIRGE